ncbi:MAG: NfeD family protein [Bacteroidota bacterium]|nr:NfeD family protein [Bacteroidota bacterium]
MGIGAIIFLIVLGLLLIWLEVLVIPGTTISGIGGIILIGGGIYLAFDQHGTSVGVWVLLSSLALLILSIIFFLKSNTWKRLSLNSSVNSKVEYFKEDSIKPGEHAKTITRLGPMGKVRVGEVDVDAESLSGLIDPGTEVVVTEVLKYKIFVKLKK